MMRVYLSQINSRVGDFAGNSEKILGEMERARGMGADLTVFPELALCGYPPEDLLFKKHFISDARRALERIRSAAGAGIVCVGFPHRTPHGLFNAAAILHKRKIAAVYGKILLPNYSVFDEKRYFIPGASVCTLKTKEACIGISICEDVWGASGPVNTLLASGISLLINLSASPYYRNKIAEREKKLCSLAKGAGIAVAYCNLVGGQDELVFDGGSFIINAQGRTIARAAQFKEDACVADIEFSRQPEKNIGLAVFPITCTPVITANGQKPSIAKPAVSRFLGPVEEVFQALVLGIRDYAHKNRFTKAVLGLSGGIDSSIVAALAAEALGKENVLGITMPTVYSSEGTRSDAALLAEQLGIGFRKIPIQKLCEGFLQALASDIADHAPDVAEENLQARVRAVALMFYSNKFGMLLLSTGNKSETSVGYSTLYGDLAGGFAPIKDIPKRLIYELSEFFNTMRGKPVIPRSVIDREPTAELRHNQKDSDSLPPYPILDSILLNYVEKHESPETLVTKGHSPEIVAKVMRLVNTSEYKRRQSPPGIKTTPLSFGKDRRMPITNFYGK